MSTTTRNEVAERLPTRDDAVRDATAMMRDWMGPPHPLAVGRALLEEALATERRATVERIRHIALNAESESYLFDGDAAKGGIRMVRLLAILDEEAAR